MGDRYLLNLNMINYETTMLESSASVDFLSMNEFDYAVDIAVLKLEGKEIFPDRSFDIPDLSLITLSGDTLDISVEFPAINTNLGEDSRRVEGMLREVLEQGDYHLLNGEYKEAVVVYEDFQQRFDQGFRGDLVNEMSYLRDYSIAQKGQAEMLLNLKSYENHLDRITGQADNGQYASAYSGVKKLSDSMESSYSAYPEIYGDLYNSIQDSLIALYGKVIESSLVTAQSQVDSEAFNLAYNRVNNILREMEANGTKESLYEIYNDIIQMKEEIAIYSRSMLDARSDEFLYSSGYYGFKADTEALQTVFKEYRESLLSNPYAFLGAHKFNKELEYYNEEFSISHIDNIEAPALRAAKSYTYPIRTGSYNDNYSQDIQAIRFLEAEREITLLYRFGSSFLSYMEEKGVDVVEFNSLLDNKRKSLSPYEEFVEGRRLLNQNIDTLEDILNDYPDLFYSDPQFSLYGDLYKEYHESNSTSYRIDRDMPIFIDRKGFPVYLISEQVSGQVSDEWESTDITSLIYNNGDGYIRKKILKGNYSDISLFIDTLNNPVISYESDDKLNILKIENNRIIKYPEIERLKNREFKKLQKQYAYNKDLLNAVFSILNIGFDNNSQPSVLMDNMGTLVQYTLDENKWKMEPLLEGNRISSSLVTQQKDEIQKTNLFFTDSMFIISRNISLEGLSWGGLFLLEYTDGAWVLSDLPAFENLQNSFLGSNSEFFLLDNRGTPGLLQNNQNSYNLIWIEKKNGQWFADLTDGDINHGKRTGRNLINTERGPVSLEILSYSYGGYFSNFGLGTSVDHHWEVVKEFQSQGGYNDIIIEDSLILSNGYGDLYVFDNRGFVMGKIDFY
ncbi:MAG: hypothetical protein B6241_14715 [Spirochaetaceae bacterium 4572_59]|nr:MAG: hypothetical protein B6241_14715 [Spirochaetaceae bacterium 4572_59]